MDSTPEAITYYNRHGGDYSIGAHVWTEKFALRDADGNLLERSPSETWERMARAVGWDASSAGYEALKYQYLVPAGRILFGLGNDAVKCTLKNCYVLAIREDSLDGVFETASRSARVYAYGGGVGIPLNKLRPRGAQVANSGRRTSGASSFMDLFSVVTGTIGQSARRGALMLQLHVDHPDIVDFIKIKDDVKREWLQAAANHSNAFYEYVDYRRAVKYANISVQVSDAFMNAVENGDMHIMTYSDMRKEIRAKDLWDSIVTHAWSSADPGVIFWDNMVRESPSDRYGTKGAVICTNPCWSGDTLVSTVEGPRSFEDLAAKGQDVEVFCYDTVTGATSIRTMRNPRQTGISEVYELIVDFHRYQEEHSVFRLTGNHQLYIREMDGSVIKIMTKDLKPGDRLIPDQSRSEYMIEDYEVFSIRLASVLPVYNGTVDEFHNYFVCNPVPPESGDTLDCFLSANCGEQGLPDRDACCLGSVNLSLMVTDPWEKTASLDWEELELTVRAGVRFLDRVITLEDEGNRYPHPEMKEMNLGFRRIGLGVLGLAEMLLKLGIRYDSEAALQLVERIFSQMMVTAYDESCELAIELGAFPWFDWEKHKQVPIISRLPEELRSKIAEHGLRNVALLSVAPTGTISIISGTSSGIEPYLGFIVKRHTHLKDSKVPEIHCYAEPVVHRWAAHNGMIVDENLILPDYFVSAHEISWAYRVRMQSVIQKYVDSSISSTVNLPASSTSDDIDQIYRTAWKLGCKGITIYREGSRNDVIRTIGKSQDPTPPQLIHTEPPELAKGIRLSFAVGEHRLLANLQTDPETGEPIEVQLRYGKTSPDLDSLAQALGIVSSLLLQYGVPADRLAHALRGIQAGWVKRVRLNPADEKPVKVTSAPDAIAALIQRVLADANQSNFVEVDDGEFCPNCRHRGLTRSGGCDTCVNCGYSSCS